MNGLSTVEKKLRENDPVKIVRQWSNGPFTYQGDSRQRTPNPDYHPTICQTETGKFVDVEGRTIPLAKVPAYIREEGKTRLALTPAPEKQELSLADAMVQANLAASSSDRPAPVKRGRGRPRKNPPKE